MTAGKQWAGKHRRLEWGVGLGFVNRRGGGKLSSLVRAVGGARGKKRGVGWFGWTSLLDAGARQRVKRHRIWFLGRISLAENVLKLG